MGMPTKYKPEYCTKIIEMMSEGASKKEVAAEFGVARQNMLVWQDKYPEFGEAVTRAEELCEAWWEKQGRTHLQNKEFNHVLWYMNMKNRFAWRDSQEHVVKGDKENPIQHNHTVEFSKMTDDELNQYLDQAKKG